MIGSKTKLANQSSVDGANYQAKHISRQEDTFEPKEVVTLCLQIIKLALNAHSKARAQQDKYNATFERKDMILSHKGLMRDDVSHQKYVKDFYEFGRYAEVLQSHCQALLALIDNIITEGNLDLTLDSLTLERALKDIEQGRHTMDRIAGLLAQYEVIHDDLIDCLETSRVKRISPDALKNPVSVLEMQTILFKPDNFDDDFEFSDSKNSHSEDSEIEDFATQFQKKLTLVLSKVEQEVEEEDDPFDGISSSEEEDDEADQSTFDPLPADQHPALLFSGLANDEGALGSMARRPSVPDQLLSPRPRPGTITKKTRGFDNA